MNRKMIYLILVLLTAPIILCAAPPQAPDSAIAPFLDDLTIAVARLDVSRVDANALADFLVGLMPEEARVEWDAQAKQNVAHVNEWKARMLGAGINEIYAVFSLDDLGRKPPIFLVADGSGPTVTPDILEALKIFLGNDRNSEHAAIGGVTVLGNPYVLERLRSMDRSTTDAWAGVFEAVPPGVLQIVIKPYDGWDRVVEELLPTLPQFVGGGPSTAFTRGLKLAWLSLEAPPNLSLRVEVQSESAADAEALRQAIAAGLENLGTQDGPREALPNWDAIQAALTPVVQGDRLVLNLDGDRVRELAEGPGAVLFGQARADALRTASVHSLKQIGLAMHMYTEDHDGALPEHLAQILPYLGSAGLLLAPAAARDLPEDFDAWPDEMKSAWVGEHSAYVYILPGKTMKDIASPGTMIAAHEKVGRRPCDDSIAAVFADGHVEILASTEELERRLSQSTE